METEFYAKDIPRDKEAAFYRTCWLAAHNRLHAIAHEDGEQKSKFAKEQWETYLAELQDAPAVITQAA